MPLSEYEQRMLEQMERQLRSDDPKLADTLGRRRRAGSRVAVGLVGALAGLGGLLGGVAAQLPWLGVAGFVVMFAAVWYVVSAPKSTASAGSKAPGRPAARKGFMQRLEERWERRREER